MSKKTAIFQRLSIIGNGFLIMLLYMISVALCYPHSQQWKRTLANGLLTVVVAWVADSFISRGYCGERRRISKLLVLWLIIPSATTPFTKIRLQTNIQWTYSCGIRTIRENKFFPCKERSGLPCGNKFRLLPKQFHFITLGYIVNTLLFCELPFISFCHLFQSTM